MKRIGILQPSYLPWLGYFDQMSRVDQFIFLDNVQFTRRDWRNRNRIRTREGWTWLTVPVQQKGRFTQSLLETRFDESTPWRDKHLKTLQSHYAKAPFFDAYFPGISAILYREHPSLAELCIDLTEWLAHQLKIMTPTQRASRLEVRETKAERILSLCQQLGATHYLSGDVAETYLSQLDFSRYNIEVEYQHYRHPEYAQRYPGFVSHLSVVDLLFNHGDNSPNILFGHAPQGT